MGYCLKLNYLIFRRAKLGQIQGGLQRASQDSTKGGGGCNNFFSFHALNVSHFTVVTLTIKKGLLLRILRCKKVPILEFLRKAIKKDSHLRVFTL